MSNIKIKIDKANKRRNYTLDVLRGFAILGMVFFTVILQLAKDLPDFLTHNVRGQAHIGDFVLPLFLFASGMSVAYFINKRKNKTKNEFLLDVIERAGKLIGISFLLSIFSTGSILGLDEIMISSIMFVFAVAFFPLNNSYYIFASLILFIFYSFLISQFSLALFDIYHLGGYQGVIFYLPVALAGLAIGKGIGDKKVVKKVLLLSSILFVFSSIFFHIDKLRVTPSFMFASTMLGSSLYLFFDFLINKFKSSFGFFAYLGQKSIRYWILMFLLFLIPLTYYYVVKGAFSLRIFDWRLAILISILLLAIFAGVSMLIDKLLIVFHHKKNH